jgi:hypothetical protein
LTGTKYHPDSILWLGLTGSGKALLLTAAQARVLRMTPGWKRISSKSFVVGGARIVYTYAEAMRLGWFDVADLFAEDEPEPDESESI